MVIFAWGEFHDCVSKMFCNMEIKKYILYLLKMINSPTIFLEIMYFY